MRRLIATALLCMVFSSSVGCFLPIYSADRQRRTEQLIFTSDNLRMFIEDWERFWFIDQPDHMTPFRTHGGII